MQSWSNAGDPPDPGSGVASVPVSIETLAGWPTPAWSRGVVLGNGSYCFADMKGGVGLVDLASGTVREVGRMSDAVSADLVGLVLGGRDWAVVADHRGAFARFDATGERVALAEIGAKVRARPRVMRGTDGRMLIAVLDAYSRLLLVDPERPGPVDYGPAVRLWPRSIDHGAVAAPLLFQQDGADKLFLADRSAAVSQIDLASGRVEWSELLPFGVDSDPVYDAASGLILFSSGESVRGAVRGVLYAYAPAERQLRWQAQLEGGADVTSLVTEWGGQRVVVTATLRDAAIYVFDLADGRALARAAVAETAACRHLPQGCVPVGYGGYHTQTAHCKFYAAPFAVAGTDGTEAICAASHNGRLYALAADWRLGQLPLGGPVRASPAATPGGTLIIHAGSQICRLAAPAGSRLVSAGAPVEQPYVLARPIAADARVRPHAAGLAGRYFKRKWRKRVIGAEVD